MVRAAQGWGVPNAAAGAAAGRGPVHSPRACAAAPLLPVDPQTGRPATCHEDAHLLLAEQPGENLAQREPHPAGGSLGLPPGKTTSTAAICAPSYVLCY